MQNEAWDRFVGGPLPDFTTEYGDEEGGKLLYYLYNVSNPKEFLTGAEKPHVTEVGPFGYAQIGRRYDVEFETEEVMKFKMYSFSKRLQPNSCLIAQERVGHPDPHRCLEPNTTVTVINMLFGLAMESVTGTTFLAAYGPFLVSSYVGMHLRTIVSEAMYLTLPNFLPYYHERFQKTIAASRFLKQLKDDTTETVAELNTATDSLASPLYGISRYFLSIGKSAATKAFATDAKLTEFYDENGVSSPLNKVGFVDWYNTTEESNSTLIDWCQADGSTDCEDRIAGIRTWLFETLSDHTENQKLMHHEFVTGNNTFACDLNTTCDWNMYPSMIYEDEPAPAISQGVYKAMFTADSSDFALTNKNSYQLFAVAREYCIEPTVSCDESQQLRDIYRRLFDGIVAIDYPSTSPDEIYANATLNAYYLKQICGMSKYYATIHQNKFFDSIAINHYPKLMPHFFSEYPSLAANMTELSDLGFLQVATGEYSQIFKSEPSLGFNSEFYRHLDQEITWEEAKLLYAIFTDRNLTQSIVEIAHFVPSAVEHAQPEYSPNIEADYTSIFQDLDTEYYGSAPQLLARRNAIGNSTIGINMVQYISKMYHDIVLLGQRIVCDDRDNCDYRKGGLFVTTTAEEFIFEGYSDPGLVYFSQLFSSRRYKISCSNPKFYFKDSFDSGYDEDETRVFHRDQLCRKREDTTCYDGAIKVHDTELDEYLYWNKTFDPTLDAAPKESKRYLYYNKTWATEESSIRVLNFYNMTQSFHDSNGTLISVLQPVQATSLGGLIRHVGFQKGRMCKPSGDDCTVATNNGINDRSLIGTIVSLFGETNTTSWPVEKPLRGSMLGQYAPAYLDGLLGNRECPKRLANYEGSMQGVLYYDLMDATVIDYDSNQDGGIPVCRYSISHESLTDSVNDLGQDPKLYPPFSFFPGPPGQNATKPSPIASSMPSFFLDQILNEGRELAKFTGIQPDIHKHMAYNDVEQGTGMTLRSAGRSAQYLKLSRSGVFPNLQEPYYMFPILSRTAAVAIPPSVAASLGSIINVFRTYPNVARGIGIGCGVLFSLIGVFLWIRVRLKRRHQKKAAGEA